MNTRQRFWRKAVASAVIYSLIFGQTVQAAQAASTDISDVPMAVKNQVAPNIMFTLDDSGSMQWEFLPEEDMHFSLFLHPRPASPYGGDTYSNQLPNFNDNNVHNFFGRSTANNKLYYNPDLTYKPWSNSDGSLMANANPAAALYNPALPAAGSTNLTAQRTTAAVWFSDLGTGDLNQAFCDPGCGVDHTYWPITYFNYNGTGSRTLRTSYTKVEITTATPATATFTSPGGVTRTRDPEIQNFANWFQYYRARVLTARAGTGKAFSTLGTTPRVGFAAINVGSTTIDGAASPSTVKTGVRPFSGTDRTNFFTTLYGHVIPAAATPLRRAMDDVGQYFSRTDDAGPWGATPGSSGGIQYSCRQNYHILTTDGYWNGAAATTSGATANVDNTSGAVIASPDGTTFQYTPANPYSDAWSDTLADAAMYYWVRDLRPDLPNNVPTNSADPAFWQHVTTFTVSIGLAGTIPLATINAAFGPTPPAITWPDPLASDPAKIDDLAHAAVNGRGGFFVATDPDTFANSLATALNNITARTGAAAAVAVANANVIAGDNASYASSYNSGTWTGDLQAFPVNLTTGQPNTAAPIWTPLSAQGQLNLRTPASRKIATYSGTAGAGQGIQFQPTTAATATKLSAVQQALLNSPVTPPGPADGAAVVAYLRGDRSGETAGTYRSRAHLLGDIINAEPVVVREPAANYSDAGYSGATGFKTANAGRTRIVLQGANDGMLHAFNTLTGAEEWAYVPNLVMADLNNLSRKNGFTHQYYVDGTPVSGDVDFSNTDGVAGNPAPNWKTILVGGLGKGGRGYYALDLTSTTTADEAAVAGKVLWEFPNSATPATVRANVGFSFGRPILVKTKARGWVVLVASGYNNGTNTGDSGGDGQGYLFVLNARTGDLIKAIGTGAGTVTDPSGLAHISGYVEAGDIDNTVEYVYGGDLKGNVWRFDLTHNSNSNLWSVAKLATLVDGLGNFQPVTTEPELAKVNIGGGVYKRFVYVGTGLYLGDTDIVGAVGENIHASQTQTMYGLVDDLSTAVITPLRASLQQQTLTPGAGGTRTASANALNFTTQKGWYMDLPSTGERANTHPALALGALVFTSNIPSTNPCVPGGSSFFNVLDYKTGGYLTGSTVPWSSVSLGATLASRVVLIKLPTGAVMGLARKSDATTVTVQVPLPSGGATTTRRSWRELMQ